MYILEAAIEHIEIHAHSHVPVHALVIEYIMMVEIEMNVNPTLRKYNNTPEQEPQQN